jgi:hypothetical protein
MVNSPAVRMTLSCYAILLLVSIILLASVTLLLTSDKNYSNTLQVKARGSESIHLPGNDNTKPLEEKQLHSIHICCSWSPDKIGNKGTGLTYTIIGASPAAEQA